MSNTGNRTPNNGGNTSAPGTPVTSRPPAKINPTTPTPKMSSFQNESKKVAVVSNTSSSSSSSSSTSVPSSARRHPEESPAVNSKKYYPKEKKENYLSHYLELLRNGTEKNIRQALAGTISIHLKNERFLNDMGIVPNKNCPCSKNDIDHKCQTLNQNDIVYLIQKYASTEEKGREWEHGVCKSCGIEMTMWNPAVETQRLSCFQICAFDVNTCLNKSSLPNLRIYCRVCCAIAEMCHYDNRMMNYYRQIFFHMTGDISPGYYFPTINIVDEKRRSVVIPANRIVGDRSDISRIWLAQNGFVTFRLPKDLELEMLQDPECKIKIDKFNCLNIQANCSDYYGNGDPDIKSIKSVAGAAAPVPPANNQGKDDDGDSYSVILPSAGGAGATVAPIPVKRGRKPAAEKKTKLEKPPIKPYETDDRFITFKIPIDPRKSVKKKSLSAMTIMPLDRNLPAEGENCLFSTGLMSGLEQRFNYDEFLRWCVDCLRLITPEFFPQKSNSYSDEKWEDEDKIKIEEIGKLSLVMKAKVDEIKKLKTEISGYEAEKKEKIKGMRSKIISLVDSNESLDLLKKHNLVATMSERRQVRATLKQDFLLNRLPELLAAHKLIPPGMMQANISEKCKQITDSLFDSSKVPQKKKTTFTLKYFNEEESKAKKDEAASKRKRAKT